MSVSELVRDILRRALAESSVAAKAGHLRGRMEIPATARDPWRRKIRERNRRR